MQPAIVDWKGEGGGGGGRIWGTEMALDGVAKQVELYASVEEERSGGGPDYNVVVVSCGGWGLRTKIMGKESRRQE